jgi:hypothetical protein
VVESGGLENRCSGNTTVGSNPTFSACNSKVSVEVRKSNYITMKQKLIFTQIFAIVILLLSTFTIKAQDEMDFEEFMGMMSETMTEDQLDQLSFQLPWNIKVCGYAYGDFSGDSNDDIVLSIKEKDETPGKSVDVYFLQNMNNETYKLVKKKNYKWREVVLEVAFMVKEGKCFVTNRDDSNWYFTSFEIKGGKLVQADKEQFPIEFENAGN